MHLVGYVRVSSDSQVDGFGLVEQERAIRRWSRANGHRVIEVARDEGRSGSLHAEDRPGLSAALDVLHRPGVDGMVVARLDRLARSLAVQEAALAVAWRRGASVYAADFGEVLADDPDDPMRAALRQMVGVFAQLDRAQVVKRLRDGRRAKAAAGRHAAGSYPYGFAGVGRGRDRDAAPLEAEQQAVRRILELRSAGQSYRAIAATLDAEGHRPRRAGSWSAAAVRKVALREQDRAA